MKPSRSFKVIAALLALFSGWICAAPMLASALIVEKKVEHADAILILGGSSTYIERTQKAAQVYKQGTAPLIFLTNDGAAAGWSRLDARNPPFVELAKSSLIAQGVPAASIEILTPPVAGTIDEAKITRKLIGERNLHSILLVTSAYHTRRTLWIFEKILSDANTLIGIEHAPTGQQTPPPFFWWLQPRGWNLVAGEYVKTVYYWLYY